MLNSFILTELHWESSLFLLEGGWPGSPIQVSATITPNAFYVRTTVLYRREYDIWLENAKSIKGASSIRRMKSDRADASMIAEYAMRNQLSQLRESFLYRQMVIRHRCSFQVRRGEKRLTMEKSSVKTMISQSGRHIVSELNKEIEKLDKRIAKLIESDE